MPFALTAPSAGQIVAGSSVTVAALDGPGQGTTMIAPITVTIANYSRSERPDIVESEGAKTEVIPGMEDHMVVTADGILLSIPAGTLDAEETVIITEVDSATTPGPLPGSSTVALFDLSLAGGESMFANPITLRIPYDDVDQNGKIDGANPVISETDLTIWRFDMTEGSWVQLVDATVVPDANVLLVQAIEGGLFGLFHATPAAPAAVGTSAEDVIPLGSVPTSADVTNNATWNAIDIASRSPFLVEWDTTALVDGLYQLRAICSDNPTALDEFLTNRTARTRGDSGGGCTLTPGARVDLTLLMLLGVMMFYLGWRRHYHRVS